MSIPLEDVGLSKQVLIEAATLVKATLLITKCLGVRKGENSATFLTRYGAFTFPLEGKYAISGDPKRVLNKTVLITDNEDAAYIQFIERGHLVHV